MALAALIVGGCAQQGGPVRTGKSHAIETYVRGVYAYQTGDQDEAVEALKAAIQANPSLIMPRAVLGRIYKQRGEYATAAEYYQQLTEMDPYEIDHHYQLGVSYQMLKRLLDAAASYRNALKLNANDFGSNMNLGLVHLALGDVDNAVRYTQKAASIRPDSAEAQANMAVALDSAGRYEEAEIAYRKSLDLAPKQAGTLVNYSNNLLAQQKWEEALQVLQEALKMEDTPYLRKRMGDAHAMGKQYDEAKQQYNLALQKNPKYYSAMNELGRVYIAEYQAGFELDDEKRDMALELWRKSLEANPRQPTIKLMIEDWERRMFSR